MSEKKSSVYAINDSSLPIETCKLESPAKSQSHGNLTVLTATVFIAGEVAGGGILTMPHALAETGWFGIALMILCCVNTGVAGIALAKSWLILEERWPQYKLGLTRKPFATIGYRAFGKWSGWSVSLCMNSMRFGAGCVFLLLTSDLMAQVMRGLSVPKLMDLGICSWAPIMGLTLTPLLWLGSPGDFWPTAYAATISTIVGSFLLLIDIGIHAHEYAKDATFSSPTFKNIFLSFGNMLFAFGGASAFPNFQNDMKEKQKFPKAVTFAYTGIVLLNIAVAATGYGVYGDGVQGNITNNLKAGTLTTIIVFCFLIHCYFAFLIIVNPVLLECEETMKIPKKFNVWRVVFRTIFMAGIIFTSESVPSFGRILDLLGGSTITIMAFIMAPAFYYKLCADKSGHWPDRELPVYMKLILLQIAVVGVVGGGASIYSSIESFLDPNSQLDPPCYSGLRTNTTYFIR